MAEKMKASAAVFALWASLKPEPKSGGMEHLDWSLDHHQRSKAIQALLPVAQLEEQRRIADAAERIAAAMEEFGARMLEAYEAFAQFGESVAEAKNATQLEPIGDAEINPHRRLFGQGSSAFGPDWDNGARAWLIRGWTMLNTPDNVRTSSTELTDDEKNALADYIAGRLTTLQRRWSSYRAKNAVSA